MQSSGYFIAALRIPPNFATLGDRPPGSPSGLSRLLFASVRRTQTVVQGRVLLQCGGAGDRLFDLAAAGGGAAACHFL